MQSIKLVKRLEGLQTVESIQKKLNIARSTAIKYVHLLRKAGFVETTGGRQQPRFYRISASLSKEIGNPGMYDIINKYSPVKLRAIPTRIIGRRLTVEETLIRAIDSGEFRTILASLALFNHIKDWGLLYKFAKEKMVRRRTGALYDVTRKIIKTKKMDRRIYNKLLQAREKEKYIVKGLKSRDYKDIENRWGLYIPFNKADLLRFKE